MKAITRPTLIACLQQALSTHPEVDAAWEGGSAAFSYRDDLSDVDAVAVVNDSALEQVFADVEAALAALSPVALRYDVPGTAGFSQKFYRLRDAGEFLVVDLVLIRRSDPLLFREVELHGQGHTWLDRHGLLKPAHVEATQDLTLARARIPALRAAFDMFQHIPTKERLRGRAVEALHFYQAMTVRPLIEALRLLYCPMRRGFGPRYLARDLPSDVVERIQALSFVSDLADLERKHTQAQAWFWEVMAELEAQGPGARRAQAPQAD